MLLDSAIRLSIVVACCLAACAPPALAQRSPVLATAHFAFFSDFDTNLNDALVAAGLARKESRPELFGSGGEAACFAALDSASRKAWDDAVGLYRREISPLAFHAPAQFLVRMQLAGFEAEWRSAPDNGIVDRARAARDAAAPAYRACRWSEQDAINRRWIAAIEPRLRADEERLAARIQSLYRKQWRKLPILVDLVQTVDWSGANTSWSDAGQGAVLLNATVDGAAGFETLFHEASHVLMDRDDPIRAALRKAAAETNVRVPGDFWHVVLFYTTGEAVRPIVEARGERYATMLYEIFKRSPDWARYRTALETEWLPYVQGTRSLDEAARGLVQAIRPGTSAPARAP